jgi:hypothetical protein
VTELGLALGAAWGAAALAGTVLAVRGRILPSWRWFFGGSAATALATSLLTGDWPEAALSAAALAVLGWDWWNRKGRRIAKALGARGRAVIAGLLERLRDAVEPVPEGATA